MRFEVLCIAVGVILDGTGHGRRLRALALVSIIFKRFFLIKYNKKWFNVGDRCEVGCG